MMKLKEMSINSYLGKKATIQSINGHKSWEDPYKKRVKKTYYFFRDCGHELPKHCAERISKRVNQHKYSVSDVLEVLEKPFNKRQEDGRLVKYYNISGMFNLQAVNLESKIKI